jgi:hypothetical protein
MALVGALVVLASVSGTYSTDSSLSTLIAQSTNLGSQALGFEQQASPTLISQKTPDTVVMLNPQTDTFSVGQNFSLSSATNFTIQFSSSLDLGATLTNLTDHSVVFDLNQTTFGPVVYLLSPGNYSLNLVNYNKNVHDLTIVAYTVEDCPSCMGP